MKSQPSQSVWAPQSVRATFARFSSACFGTGEAPVEVDVKSVGKYIVVSLILALVLVARRFDAISNPQFWAEDGTIYFRENLLYGFWQALAHFYRGFPYLLQRLIAAAATPFCVTRAPLVYNLAAITVAAGVCAFFTLPHFRHIVRSDRLRVLFCVALVSLPDSQELVAVLTNIHWYLAIWALLASVMTLPRSRWGKVVIFGGYAVSVASAPLAVITAPIWLLRLVSAVIARRLVEGIWSAAMLATMATVLVFTTDLGVESEGGFEPRSFVEAFSNLVVIRVIAHAMVGTRWTVETAAGGGTWVWYLIAGSAVALGVVLSAFGRFKSFPVSLLCCYAIISSVFVTLAGRGAQVALGLAPFRSVTTVGETHVLGDGRYFVLGIAMVYLSWIAALDRLPAGTAKIVATTTMVCGLVYVLSQSFVLIPFLDFQWQQRATLLSAELIDDGDEVVVIPINPPPFQILLGDLARLEELPRRTDGRIETVGGIKVVETQGKPISVAAGRPIEITGWAVDRSAFGPARGVAVTVDDREHVWAHYELFRPDVATALSNPAYVMSGFRAIVTELPPGRHTLELKIVTQDGRSYFKPVRETQRLEIEVQ